MMLLPPTTQGGEGTGFELVAFAARVPCDDEFAAGASDADIEQAQAFSGVINTGGAGGLAFDVIGATDE